MSKYELAQLNIAIMREPLDSPRMADFVANLDRINLLAEESPGFIWRFQTEKGDATTIRPLDEVTLINISVWRDIEALHRYVYSSEHAKIMRRRNEWFEQIRDAYIVLWWIPEGQRPTPKEAIEKLELFKKTGPSEEAFNFRQIFSKPI